MPWMLRNVGTATDYPVVDAGKSIVSTDLRKLNDAKVICAMVSPIDVGTEVIVRDDVVSPTTKQVIESHELIRGRVQKYAQISKGVSTNTYEFTIKELAVDLEKFRINATGSYTVNVNTPSNVPTYVDVVLNNSTWVKLGGQPTGATIPAMQFRYMTAIAGLNKVITELGNGTNTVPFYMWFDNTAKTVGWGTSRNTRTGTNFIKGIYYNYEEFKTNRVQASGVVIYGANSSSHGQYPVSPTGHDLAVFQYDSATTDAECAALAERVYNDWCKDPKRRIQFNLRPTDTKVGGYYILEGDTIQVDSSNYVIIDMTYTPKDVLVGVNAGEDSILFQLGDKLKPVAGSSSGATEVVWTPGVQNVSSDGTTKSKFILDISDPVDISDSTVMLNVEIGPYKAYSYQNATDVANAILSEVSVPAHFDATAANIYLAPFWVAALPVIGTTSYMETPTAIDGGFQYALATINFTIQEAYYCGFMNPGTIYIWSQYSYNGTEWFDGTYQARIECEQLGATEYMRKPISNTYSIPGIVGTTKVYIRWWVLNQQVIGNRGYELSGISGMLDVFPRHSHTFNQTGQAANKVKADQTDNLKESDVSPPATVTCLVNGVSHVVSNNTPFDIKDHLIAGKNSIEFTSTTVCTVTPSTHFMMFG